MWSIFPSPPLRPFSSTTTPEMANPRTKNITYDDRDTTNLKYGPNWFHIGTWNASSVGQSGTLTVANDLNASVTFSFPEPAIAFYYFGMLRKNGGLYSVCIDCDPNQPDFQTIDALNATDDGKNPPVALFSKRFDVPAQHNVTLSNRNDTRIVPGGSSQITIDRFVLEVLVVDNSPIQVTPSSPSPSSTSDSAEKPGPPFAAIIGAVLGGIGLGLFMIGLYSWRHRKRRQPAFAHDDVNVVDASEASFPTIVPYPVMIPSIPKGGRPKAGKSRRTPQRPPSPTTSSGSTTIVAYFRFQRQQRRERRNEMDTAQIPERRREADAGPIPFEDGASTLPPLYEQVFQAGPSNRPPPD
ncbi:hypothetical protein PM082_003609 [Marasmius tenuissimus]|nr:hypothetical protein PM082_003609 [Marasmius tenuissimus]